MIATVSEIRNWSDFAVWRAARASGDHDPNTLSDDPGADLFTSLSRKVVSDH